MHFRDTYRALFRVWVCVMLALLLVGCFGPPMPKVPPALSDVPVPIGVRGTGYVPTSLAASSADPFAPARTTLAWLGALVTAGGVVLLILSAAIPLIPRKMATTALACGLGCLCAVAFLARFGQTILWLALGVVILGTLCLVLPLITTLRNAYKQRQAGKALIVEGRVNEGVAVLSTVSRKINKNRKEIADGLASSAGRASATAATFGLPLPLIHPMPQAIPENSSPA